jgi:hypothetical protein
MTSCLGGQQSPSRNRMHSQRHDIDSIRVPGFPGTTTTCMNYNPASRSRSVSEYCRLSHSRVKTTGMLDILSSQVHSIEPINMKRGLQHLPLFQSLSLSMCVLRNTIVRVFASTYSLLTTSGRERSEIRQDIAACRIADFAEVQT